jgi:hypothetical protein
MNGCVVVLGPYRSGTSLVSQLLQALGADFGPADALISTNRFNPGGYLERGDVNAWNRRLILSAGHTLGEPGDAEELSQRADLSILKDVKFPWASHGPIWALKDPRFCASLVAWTKAEALPVGALRIVLVDRDPDAILRSSLEHPSVRKFCEGDPIRARAMIEAYRSLAAWQVNALGVPTHRIQYESLVANPQAEVGKLGDWLGSTHPRQVDRASGLVGKRAAYSRYLIRTSCRLPVRAVRKAARLIGRAGT